MVKKKGLGKGLNALFGDVNIKTVNPSQSSDQTGQGGADQSLDVGNWSDGTSNPSEGSIDQGNTFQNSDQNIDGMKGYPSESGGTKRNSTDSKGRGEPLKVNIAYIEPNRNQPRKVFKDEELQELAESVSQYGIIQPILVKKIHESKFEIIAGERRWRAAKIVGLKEIPVIIKDFSDREAMEVSIIENIQRMDLNPIEEAKAYQSLMDEYGLTQEEVAAKVAKKRATIGNALRLLRLDERVQQMTIDKLLSSGHAKVLLTIEDREMQKQIADEVVLQKMSVRDLEKYLKVYAKKMAAKPQKSVVPDRDYSIFFQEYEEHFRRILGTKVHINRKDKNKGRIEIDYYSEAELERIMDLIKSIG